MTRREAAQAIYDATRDALGNNETEEQRAAYNVAAERIGRYWDADDARTHHYRMIEKYGHDHKLTRQAADKIAECIARIY